MIVRNVQIVVIFWVSAIQLVVGNDFSFVYSYASPNSILLRVTYDYYRIERVTCQYNREFSQIYKSDDSKPIQIYTIQHLSPCTTYQCNANVRDLRSDSSFEHGESILMLPLDIVLQAVPFSSGIGIEINPTVACFDSLYLKVNNWKTLSYTRDTLSKWLTIRDWSPCRNYKLEIYIINQSKYYQIFDKTITTISSKPFSGNSIDYDPTTTLLRWRKFLEDCPLKYVIYIKLERNQFNLEPIKHESFVNEFKLDFLDDCSEYHITVTSENEHGPHFNITIKTGNKVPGPISNLTVALRQNQLLINWSPPVTNPACNNVYLVLIDGSKFSTMAHNHVMNVTEPNRVYNVSVCQYDLEPKYCAHSTFDLSTEEVVECQNISKFDVNTNYTIDLTTISWNVSNDEKHCVKCYMARLYIGWKQIKTQECVSAKVIFPGLFSCQKYRLEIESHPYEIKSNFEFTTKPKIPDAPTPPKIVSHKSRSFTLETKYINSNDECKIEMFEISCKNAAGTIVRSIYDENGRVTINNLKSYTSYDCTATVKNEMGWSMASSITRVSTDRGKSHRAMHVNSVSSTSIGISWITNLNGNWSLNITKVQLNGKIPKYCVVDKNNHLVTQSDNSGSFVFENLAPNSNYSIRMDGTSQENQKHYEEIFETTDPDVPFKVTNLQSSHSANQSITVTWQLPCEVNGRIKSFVGKFLEFNRSGLTNTVYDWEVPYHDTEIFSYTENRIKPEHKYKISVAIRLHNFVGALNESTVESDDSIPSNASFDVIIALLLLCLALVLILVAIRWYYTNKKIESLPPDTVSSFIEVEYFTDFYKFLSKGFYERQYQSINDMDTSGLDQTISKNQPGKNRYTDITPYDYNRVVLGKNEFCTTGYINASYIDGYRHKKQYIATQGPVEETVYDFWHMVVEQKCNKIVMLTQLREDCVTKCFKYFPNEDEILRIHDLEIANADEVNFGNFIRRGLVISKGAAKRFIVHYQFIAWPDRDCPANKFDLIEFIEFTKNVDNKSKNPVIVHCSAGVGRSGTFIALDLLLQSFQNDKYISVYETVRKLRKQRCRMVQTVDQYEFLYDSVNMFYLKRIHKGK